MSTPTPRGMRACLCSHSTPGRIAAAMMIPRKNSAMTTLSFQRASAATTIERATSVAIAARFAVDPMSRVSSRRVEAGKPMLAYPEEHVFLDARRHGVVLMRPLMRALVLALLGAAAFLGGWPISVAGAVLLVVAA